MTEGFAAGAREQAWDMVSLLFVVYDIATLPGDEYEAPLERDPHDSEQVELGVVGVDTVSIDFGLQLVNSKSSGGCRTQRQQTLPSGGTCSALHLSAPT